MVKNLLDLCTVIWSLNSGLHGNKRQPVWFRHLGKICDCDDSALRNGMGFMLLLISVGHTQKGCHNLTNAAFKRYELQSS